MSKLATVLLTMLPLGIQANEGLNSYHFSSAVEYGRVDAEYEDSYLWDASLKYYWNPVIHSNQYPNRETAFVNRLGSAGVQYKGGTDDSHYVDALITEIDISLIYAEKEMNHVFQLDYSWRNVDIEQDYHDQYSDTHSVGFAYNYYLLDNLTIGVNFSADFLDSLAKDNTYERFSFSSNSIKHDSEKYSYGFNTKYLMGLGNESWIAFKANYLYADTKNEYEDYSHSINASIEYYFNPITSIKVAGGANFTTGITSIYYDSTGLHSRESTINDGVVSVYLYHFFTDQFSLNINFTKTFTEIKNDTQIYRIGINYLF
jgi:hypothetical protein